MITALCGGVGGSKLALGLYRMLPPHELRVVVNTADDLEYWGLHVSPDLDTVTYTLGGLAQHGLGWGVEGDTFHTLEAMQRYGADSWFRVGDYDLGTHLIRTQMLRGGASLTAVTAHISACLGIHASILPMTNDPVSTQLRAGERWLEFQEYFVRERHAVPIDEVRYVGIDAARPTEETIEALRDAEVIVIVNSNPMLSILPILSLPGVGDLVRSSNAPRVAVSPLVGIGAVSGPAGELMRLTGHPGTALGLAQLYRDSIDGMAIDRVDAEMAPAIRALGLEVLVTDTIMRTDTEKERLAAEVLRFVRGLA